MKKLFCLAAVFAVLLGATPAAAAESISVVELFTSQGCSSCPPADKVLRQLSKRRDVIALAHHVDYWNYIGWEDPFSSKEASARQRRYARILSNWSPYTPQVVVDGRHDVAGFKRSAILQRISNSLQEGDVQVLKVEHSSDGSESRVMLPPLRDGYVMWRIDYDRRHETEVERGENAGRSLINANVVRDMAQISDSDRALGEVIIDKDSLQAQGRGGAVVLVQQGRVGPIIAAGHVRVTP
ncbi:MAG: DUF1223 domain-containing protein [Alphaproteobacteria bacterium GM202ARS2]|nr:DUF1223 domain-containing protein [Alphaproteobacteria bacterium GM202ARS2]